MPSSLAPSLLIALPALGDPNFRRTVVLLVHHDEDGTVGLVLNRRTDLSAADLCETLDVEWLGDPEWPVNWGGPVQPNTGWVVAGGPDLADLPEATRFADDLHFAGSLDALRRVAASMPAQLRLFLGYAGWGPGQLETRTHAGRVGGRAARPRRHLRRSRRRPLGSRVASARASTPRRSSRRPASTSASSAAAGGAA